MTIPRFMVALLLVALFLGLLLAAPVPSAAAAAEQQKSQASKSDRWKTQPQKKAPVAANPCAQHGAGFVQLQGTSTCVRMDGSILMEMGTSTRGR
jgi:hypothetical protein